MTDHHPQSSKSVIAHYSSDNLYIGAGVAIFHIASQRVVLCSENDNRGRKYYFLPKGRRDAGEESGRNAEREGFEESGYRNRLLPLPIKHRQPQPPSKVSNSPLTAEPVWTQLLPMAMGTRQYILYWYIAETLPPDIENEMSSRVSGTEYEMAPRFPSDLKLRDRVLMEPKGYEPVHHKNTGVNADELAYESYLLPIKEAIQLLGSRGVMADVVRKGWQGICQRWADEESVEDSSKGLNGVD
ncbi:hypothetical protein K432DRAFT_406303 [Lepidopterella palustris CBS 459.81]|uniref:Nudix hydrolase domain-containing protein n=1 Tax=Lepidopterella palustris CBS 459.81 TaxID=1314670 RepID=A0A8E2E791_9PEZI|nr:hypothetical protein K432DRAFT_406303 [Lepidopterella palustris CBS 459.81]